MVYHIDSTPIDHAVTFLHNGMSPVVVVSIVAGIVILRAAWSAFFPKRFR